MNNWTSEDYARVVTFVTKKSVAAWIFGKEEGEEGTPHLQGYVRFKNHVRFTTIKNALPRAHIEKAKGSDEQNYVYCSKEGQFETNMAKPPKRTTKAEMLQQVRQLYQDVEWKPWQSELLDIISGETSPRKIYWIYDKCGNVGKTYLTKFLCLEPSTVMCQGKATDIFHMAAKMTDENILPTLFICDIPRTLQDQNGTYKFVSWSALEAVKNGLIASGKYEGAQLNFPYPKVICFANEKPCYDKLSKDRWQVAEIKDDKLFWKVVV